MKYKDTHTRNHMACAKPLQQDNRAISCHVWQFFGSILPPKHLAHDQAFEQAESQSKSTIVHKAIWNGSDNPLSNDL